MVVKTVRNRLVGRLDNGDAVPELTAVMFTDGSWRLNNSQGQPVGAWPEADVTPTMVSATEMWLDTPQGRWVLVEDCGCGGSK